MRDLTDILTRIHAVVAAHRNHHINVDGLLRLRDSARRSVLDVPEAPRGWGRAAEFVDAIIQADRDVTPLKFEASERWRAEVLAIWRGCTVDDLATQGLVVVAPEPKPVDETWRERLEALCAEHGWGVAIGDARALRDRCRSSGGDSYIGSLSAFGDRPRQHIEVFVVEYSGRYALDFRPLHEEATGRAQANAARAAFDRASAFADILEAAGPWPFEWPAVDAADDDIPF